MDLPNHISIRAKVASLALALMFLSLQVSSKETPSSDTPDRRPGWTAGIGAIHITQAYRSIKDRFVPMPFISYRGPRFAVLGPRISYRILGVGPAVFNAIANWRFAGYDPDDSPFLTGMEKRQDTLEAGASLEFRLPFQSAVQAEWRADTLGRNNGYEASLSLRRTFGKDRLRAAPFIDWTYLSPNMSDTYYGVRPAEARADRPAYNPGASGAISAGIAVFLKTREGLSLFTSFRVSRLEKEITRSPIISDNQETRTIVGIMWNFQTNRT